MSTAAPDRAARRREATYAAIVSAAIELLDEGAELSLRAVAARVGLTGPALYRYVDHSQQLVDLVAYKVDRTAAARIAATVAEVEETDPAARLVVAATELRTWALAQPRAFGLVFANPVATPRAGPANPLTHRELVTVTSTGLLFSDLLHRLWEGTRFPLPALGDLPAAVCEAVLDPVVPGTADDLPAEHRGLIWVSLQAWTRLYGVVSLEVFGHVDPRLVASGEMFVDVLRDMAAPLGLLDDVPRLESLVRSRLSL